MCWQFCLGGEGLIFVVSIALEPKREARQKSVQTFTFSSRIKVTTLTHLDDLAVDDECSCEEVIPPPDKFKPMHLVFLVDGSDGYNEKTKNKCGYTEGWVDYSSGY